MGLKFTNFGQSTIANVGGIGTGDLSVDVQAGEGALFPSLVAGEYFYCVMVKSTGAREIVKVTARATDTLTIVRAQEGTSALAFDADDVISHRVTAAALQEFADIVDFWEDLTATVDEINDSLDGNTALAAELSLLSGAENIVKQIDSDEAISGAASVTFTGLSAGKRYRLEFELIRETITATQLALRFGNSGGVDSGANYASLVNYTTIGPSDAVYHLAGQTSSLINQGGYLSSYEFMMGYIEFSSMPGDGTIIKYQGHISAYDVTVPFESQFLCSGYYDGASTVDRVQLLVVPSTTFGGRVRLYQTN